MASETVFCVFRVQKGRGDELLKLCREHDETLRRLDLVTHEPAKLFRGEDHGGSFIFKIFAWKSAVALDAARQHPEVQRLWEAMEPLCEERGGQPSMEFPHVVPVEL